MSEVLEQKATFDSVQWWAAPRAWTSGNDGVAGRFFGMSFQEADYFNAIKHSNG